MRVLLVDDHHEEIEAMCEYLGHQVGIDDRTYEVTAIRSHREAVELLESERRVFEVVVVDMVTVDRNDAGLTVIEKLSSRSEVTIVLTAHPRFPMCVRALRAGAWDYLEKVPYDGRDSWDALLESIQEGCRAKSLAMVPADVEWIQENVEVLMREHAGEWIAVIDQLVIASASDYSSLSAEVEGKGLLARPVIWKVPAPEVEIVKGEES